jgi:hypothetical protein
MTGNCGKANGDKDNGKMAIVIEGSMTTAHMLIPHQGPARQTIPPPPRLQPRRLIL